MSFFYISLFVLPQPNLPLTCSRTRETRNEYLHTDLNLMGHVPLWAGTSPLHSPVVLLLLISPRCLCIRRVCGSTCVCAECIPCVFQITVLKIPLIVSGPCCRSVVAGRGGRQEKGIVCWTWGPDSSFWAQTCAAEGEIREDHGLEWVWTWRGNAGQGQGKAKWF